jgi:hypothetical protein
MRTSFSRAMQNREIWIIFSAFSSISGAMEKASRAFAQARPRWCYLEAASSTW